MNGGSNGENGINNENEIMKAKIIISGSIGSNNGESNNRRNISERNEAAAMAMKYQRK
jgi:hypothetical protein